MSESHLARSLFSQPANAVVRKKKVASNSAQKSSDKSDKTDKTEQIEPIESIEPISQAPSTPADQVEMPMSKTAPEPNYAELQASYDQLQKQHQALQLAHNQLQLDLNRSIELTKSLQSSLEAQIRQSQQQSQKLQSLMLEKQELEAKLAISGQDSDNPQILELQTQIEQKTKQLQEAQATIQHWREQALKHHQHAIQLSGALERLLEEKPSLKPTPQASSPVPPAVNAQVVVSPATAEKPMQRSQVELPSFLTRSR